MSPQRIQRRRISEWRMPEGAVYVGRPTIWGNPFIIGRTIGCDDAAAAAAMHCAWLEQGHTAPYPLPGETAGLERLRDVVLARAHELTGRDLACYCPSGQPCHADVLLELAVHSPAGAAAEGRCEGEPHLPDPAAPAGTTPALSGRPPPGTTRATA